MFNKKQVNISPTSAETRFVHHSAANILNYLNKLMKKEITIIRILCLPGTVLSACPYPQARSNLTFNMNFL